MRKWNVHTRTQLVIVTDVMVAAFGTVAVPDAAARDAVVAVDVVVVVVVVVVANPSRPNDFKELFCLLAQVSGRYLTMEIPASVNYNTIKQKLNE